MADTASPAPAAPVVKPTRPDEKAFQENLAKAQKEHDEVMGRYKAIKEKIELTQPSKNSDTPNPTQKRRQELIAQANEIRQKQAGGKNARNTKLDQIKRLDEQLRSRIAEQKTARGKVPFKSVDEIDREIDRLERQVNGGMMKLVDEKKALTEISGLRKQRKNFSQFDDAQKHIDDLRAKIKEIKDSMEDPEAKALSEQYNKIQAELDAIKAEQDGAYKNLSALRDERSKLQAEQREKYDAIKKLRDEYYHQKKAAQAYEREAKQKIRERQKAERDRIEKERKKERAQRLLAEASDPAYLEEIRRANSLLHFFDPSHVADKGPLVKDSGLSAHAQRKVDDSGLKGTRLVRKEDREDDYLAPVKKGKKGKKGGAAADSAPKFFSCPPSVMEDCAFMGIDPPMSSADVPAIVEKIKAKLEHWKSDQAAQTQRNIEKAKKEIEKLESQEAEEEAAAKGSGAATPNGVNGKSDDKAVADVTADLKDASIEDKKEEATA
ncbi:Nuclear segregation protein (Bfr1) [Pleurostoma richardsiae]|uniref:Nuclear segregation protein (Bfr1) n=1 Tax=Pleurostoma richardsiae TaxID=41990 RepID=A0AA38R770_9PEZI|nr:Nuclear segregation protein (Bfr1) [Pleurostoma richardsiae]